MSDERVERVARALCAASSEQWREGTYEVASGPNFELEDHPLDPFNNHWRYKARAAITALEQSDAVMGAMAKAWAEPLRAEIIEELTGDEAELARREIRNALGPSPGSEFPSTPIAPVQDDDAEKGGGE